MSHSHSVVRIFGRIAIVVVSVGMLWLNEGFLVPAEASGTVPTINSDKADYSAGELVTLTGTGWTGDATVHLDVNDTLGKTWEHTADVPVDANGNISESFNLPDRFVSDYDVAATGNLSGRTASTTFTDSAGYSFSLKAAVPSAYPRLQPGSGTGRLACPGTN